MGWTERKVNRGEGNKRRWKEEDGKQGEEEEEIRPNHIRIQKIKNRNPQREILHPRTAWNPSCGFYLFSHG